MGEQVFACCRRLDHRTVGRKITLQHANARRRTQRVVERADDVVVIDLRGLPIFADRNAENRRCVGMKQVLDTVHHGRQAARIGEILDEILARRHAVDDAGHLTAYPIEILETEVDTRAPGDRQHVDHGIGRSADGGIGDDAVLEVLPCQDFRQLRSSCTISTMRLPVM